MTARYRPTPDVTTAMRSPYSSEKEFQALVIDLAQRHGFRVYHTFNSRRSAAGYPDVTLVRAGRLLFLELKSKTGRVTDEQKEWITALQQARVEAYVMRSTGDRVEDAKGIADVLREKPKAVAA